MDKAAVFVSLGLFAMAGSLALRLLWTAWVDREHPRSDHEFSVWSIQDRLRGDTDVRRAGLRDQERRQ